MIRNRFNTRLFIKYIHVVLEHYPQFYLTLFDFAKEAHSAKDHSSEIRRTHSIFSSLFSKTSKPEKERHESVVESHNLFLENKSTLSQLIPKDKYKLVNKHALRIPFNEYL